MGGLRVSLNHRSWSCTDAKQPTDFQRRKNGLKSYERVVQRQRKGARRFYGRIRSRLSPNAAQCKIRFMV